MAADLPPQLRERLAAWRKVVAQAEAEAQRARAVEECFVRVAMTLIWLAGLVSCFFLAWRVSGHSLVLTVLPLLFPIGAWWYYGFYRWALLLPLSLIGLLALIGAFLLL